MSAPPVTVHRERSRRERAGRGAPVRLLAGREDRVVHVAELPSRPAVLTDWPVWADPELVAAWRRAGVERPYVHQRAAADLAHDGTDVVVATGTASGKSLAFLLPALTAAREGGTTLYLAPTKALAADQERALTELGVPDVRVACVDGDTPREARDWARAHAHYVLTNPDLLHASLLPSHTRWNRLLRGLRYVVVDEVHAYRGVFGSHVAAVLRRLLRVAAHHGADPTVVLASATCADPARSASLLAGRPVAAVTEEAAPRGRFTVALWEPPLTSVPGEGGAPVRRSATAETADLLADLVVEGCRTLAFVRSRRGAEAVALLAREHLREAAPKLVDRVAAYRAGYLPEERRRLERRLADPDGEDGLLGLAATNALELGVDVTGLDAVVCSGWPGTRASFWQQVGRAGRDGQDALGVLVARDDPLDTYLVHHPEALLGQPVEATVLDPDNPYVLGPHLAAAAAELPVTEADLARFGPRAEPLLDDLVAQGLLRRRATGWFWTQRGRAADLVDLRGTGGSPVRICELGTGRLLGTVDRGSADRTVHPGAVYVHQGETYLVEVLDLVEGVALVEPASPDVTTMPRIVTDLVVLDERRRATWTGALGEIGLAHGDVEVTTQVVGFVRRRVGSGEVLGEEPLDLPSRSLVTRATWWTLSPEVVGGLAMPETDLPGALHAAEHASIGLLPLVATCDRWDVGGLSTAAHPDTGLPTVFVHDGHPGGAGFAERGFAAAGAWLRATRGGIAACGCPAGCPSCVQSPKCGNGNHPLDKAGAVAVLDAVLDALPDTLPDALPDTLPDELVRRGTS